MSVCTHTPQKEQQNKGLKEWPCADNEERHSLDIVFRTLFPAVKLRNVLFMSRPKGLHSGNTTAQMTHQQKTLHQEDGNEIAAYHKHDSFACWPNRKTDPRHVFQTCIQTRKKHTITKRLKKNQTKQNRETTWLKIYGAEVSKFLRQRPIPYQLMTPKGYD